LYMLSPGAQYAGRLFANPLSSSNATRDVRSLAPTAPMLRMTPFHCYRRYRREMQNYAVCRYSLIHLRQFCIRSAKALSENDSTREAVPSPKTVSV